MSEQNIKHGTATAYSKAKCRCELCKQANREYRKTIPITEHGKLWSYDKGCRCDLCKQAKTDRWHRENPNTRKPTTNIEKMTRVCYTCKEEKSLESFTKNKNEPLGRLHECKKCHNLRSKAGRKNTPTQRFSTYISGARVRKIKFDLSFDDFMSFWEKPCFYCDAPIDGIGLDRKDSNIGYTMDNVVPCCARCNRSKTIQTTEDFIEMCIKVAEKFKNSIVPSK